MIQACELTIPFGCNAISVFDAVLRPRGLRRRVAKTLSGLVLCQTQLLSEELIRFFKVLLFLLFFGRLE